MRDEIPDIWLIFELWMDLGVLDMAVSRTPAGYQCGVSTLSTPHRTFSERVTCLRNGQRKGNGSTVINWPQTQTSPPWHQWLPVYIDSLGNFQTKHLLIKPLCFEWQGYFGNMVDTWPDDCREGGERTKLSFWYTKFLENYSVNLIFSNNYSLLSRSHLAMYQALLYLKTNQPVCLFSH